MSLSIAFTICNLTLTMEHNGKKTQPARYVQPGMLEELLLAGGIHLVGVPERPTERKYAFDRVLRGAHLVLLFNTACSNLCNTINNWYNDSA